MKDNDEAIKKDYFLHFLSIQCYIFLLLIMFFAIVIGLNASNIVMLILSEVILIIDGLLLIFLPIIFTFYDNKISIGTEIKKE